MISLDNAACRRSDPDLFFPAPKDDRSAQAAKRVCARCPLRLDCLALALEMPDVDGVWGGLTRAERLAHARR